MGYGPHLLAEYVEGACFKIYRLNGLCTWYLLEGVVERRAFVPCKGLHLLCAESRVVPAFGNLFHGVLYRFGLDEWRCGVCKYVYIGIDILCKGVVNLLSQGLVTVERLVAFEELDALRQQRLDLFAAAIYIYFVYCRCVYERVKDIL